jgi:hypothetical protein
VRRIARWLTLTAVVGAAVVVAHWPAAPEISAAHTLLHLNCPPGSHGPVRSDGVGRSLMDARDQAKNSRP